MADILHSVGIKSSQSEVYKALATREGLAAWWANDTRGESKVGGVVQFTFTGGGVEKGRIAFKHQGWKEPVEFMHHCSTKWAIFLMSLKSLLETGKGLPNPHDVSITSWD